MTTHQDAVPPVVCTLTTKDRAEQVVEWSDLAALSLSNELISGGVACTYPISLAEQIDDLATRERNCCGSWLNIAVVRLADAVRVEFTTSNPDGLAMIVSMSGATV